MMMLTVISAGTDEHEDYRGTREGLGNDEVDGNSM